MYQTSTCTRQNKIISEIHNFFLLSCTSCIAFSSYYNILTHNHIRIGYNKDNNSGFSKHILKVYIPQQIWNALELWNNDGEWRSTQSERAIFLLLFKKYINSIQHLNGKVKSYKFQLYIIIYCTCLANWTEEKRLDRNCQ